MKTYEADALLSIGEAAALIGVHPDTVRNWERRGLVTPIRTPGGHRRYNRNIILGMKGRYGMDEIKKALENFNPGVHHAGALDYWQDAGLLDNPGAAPREQLALALENHKRFDSVYECDSPMRQDFISVCRDCFVGLTAHRFGMVEVLSKFTDECEIWDVGVQFMYENDTFKAASCRIKDESPAQLAREIIAQEVQTSSDRKMLNLLRAAVGHRRKHDFEKVKVLKEELQSLASEVRAEWMVCSPELAAILSLKWCGTRGFGISSIGKLEEIEVNAWPLMPVGSVIMGSKDSYLFRPLLMVIYNGNRFYQVCQEKVLDPSGLGHLEVHGLPL